MKKTAIRWVLPLIAGFVASLSCNGIGAAAGLAANTKQSERTYRSAPESEGALTPAMIESCIVLKGDIDKSQAEFVEIETQYKALGKEIEAQKGYLEALEGQKSFDPSDSQELAAYNERQKAYNAKLNERKKLHETMLAKKAVYDQQIDKLTKECKGQPYYEDDYAAAVKKMGHDM
jgi:hypothetical protein